MKGKQKISLALVTLVLLASASGVVAQIYSDGQQASSNGDIISYDVASQIETSVFGGFFGNADAELFLSDNSANKFVTLGNDSPEVVLITTESSELNESSLTALTASDLTALDTALSLSSAESFTEIYTESELLEFGTFSEVTYFKMLESGLKTYLVKTSTSTVNELNDVVFTAVVQSDATAYNGDSVDYECLVYAKDDNIYNFNTV